MKFIPIVLLFILTACGASFNDDMMKDVHTPKNVYEKGVATWYGPGFDGRTTSSGQITICTNLLLLIGHCRWGL